MLVEDYNYLFNPPIVELLDLVGSLGKDGVVHVEVGLTLDLLGAGSPFSDPGYPSHRLPGGAITDFLPHLASLAHGFVGRHRRVATIRSKRQAASHLHSDEFRALIDAEDGTAALFFSSNSQPNAMWVHVETAAFRATASIFDPRLVITRSRSSAGPFQGVAGGVSEAATIGRAAVGGLLGKVSGRMGSLDGLTELVARTHRAAAAGADPPVSPRQIDEVNALVAALVDESNYL
jgi:predicted dehydrogenase